MDFCEGQLHRLKLGQKLLTLPAFVIACYTSFYYVLLRANETQQLILDHYISIIEPKVKKVFTNSTQLKATQPNSTQTQLNASEQTKHNSRNGTK